MALVGAGLLLVVLGLGCGLGGLTLRRGAPASWTDVTAEPAVVRKTAIGLLLVSPSLLLTGVLVLLGVRSMTVPAALVTLIFVAGGFVGNYAVFGGIRLAHTGTNVVVAAAIWLLLWFG